MRTLRWAGFVTDLTHQCNPPVALIQQHGANRRPGLRYWLLADFLKRQSGAAERYIERFVKAGLDDARLRGLDGTQIKHLETRRPPLRLAWGF